MLEEQTRNEGKPEQAIAQDRRGPAQRLLQGRSCCSSSRSSGTRRRRSASSSTSLGGDATRAPVRARQDRRGVGRRRRRGVPMPESQYRRVVLKLSGEAFADTRIGFGIDAAVVQRIAEEVADARAELERRDRDRRRRRQHLPRHERREPGHGPRPRRLHGHARHRHQRARAAGRARSRSGSRRGCRPRSRWRRSPSRTSRCGRSATSRRAGSWSSRPAPATRTSRPTPPPRCGPPRSAPRRS